MADKKFALAQTLLQFQAHLRRVHQEGLHLDYSVREIPPLLATTPNWSAPPAIVPIRPSFYVLTGKRFSEPVRFPLRLALIYLKQKYKLVLWKNLN